MKNIQEFRTLVEEEKSDYSKFDMLVRAGLANKAQLARIHRILDKMKEEKPVFNNADRMIIQNLFNKMVDLISNNQQIFQKTRQVVREETEDVLQLNEATPDLPDDPPFVLIFKRKAIRMYPNKTKIALYHNQKLDKLLSIPYGPGVENILQTEKVEPIEENVMDQLHKIVAGKQAQSVKFGNGQSKKIDHFTASAITQVHNAVNDENKKKFADMVARSAHHMQKAAEFSWKSMK